MELGKVGFSPTMELPCVRTGQYAGLKFRLRQYSSLEGMAGGTPLPVSGFQVVKAPWQHVGRGDGLEDHRKGDKPDIEEP